MDIKQVILDLEKAQETACDIVKQIYIKKDIVSRYEPEVLDSGLIQFYFEIYYGCCDPDYYSLDIPPEVINSPTKENIDIFLEKEKLRKRKEEEERKKKAKKYALEEQRKRAENEKRYYEELKKKYEED